MGGTVLVALFVAGAGGLALHQWVQNAKPPPPNLRCGNCPKQARTIRALQLGLAGLLGLWVLTFAWGLAR